MGQRDSVNSQTENANDGSRLHFLQREPCSMRKVYPVVHAVHIEAQGKV